MRQGAIAIALALFGMTVSVNASPIVVRSGEHQGFTRIVMQLPEDAKWTLNNSTGKSVLEVDGQNSGFDISTAFSIIPRTRLSALLARSDSLEFQLNCDCPVEAFLEKNNFLVVDILDGPEIQAPIEEIPVSSEPPATQFSYGELLWRLPGQSIPEPFAEDGDAQRDTSDPEPQLTEAEADLLTETRETLLRSFSQAASQGLVDTKRDADERLSQIDTDAPEAEIFDASEAPVADTDKAQEHLRVTSSKDVPQSAQSETDSLSGVVCPEPERVAVHDWSNGSDFSTELAKFRRALFDDAGHENITVALDMARFFLHFGFGAEAEEALRLVPESATHYPELIDLARILEHGHARNPRLLHRYPDCNSDLALWGMLAAKPLPESRVVNANAALRAFEKLPDHLKIQLAKDLSNRFLDQGDTTSAQTALRIAARTEDQSPRDPVLAEVEILKSAGSTKDSENVLSQIVKNDTTEAPEAVMTIIEQHVAQDKPVPADIALLAEAYAFELRGTELGDKVHQAFMLATIKSDQFGKAIQILSDTPLESDGENLDDLISYAFSEMSQRAADAEFLQQYFMQKQKLVKRLDRDATIRVAHRLWQVGFIEEAKRIVSTLPTDANSEVLAVLQAQIFLSNRSGVSALNSLKNISGTEADLLRAKALQLMGKDGEAIALFRGAGAEPRAVETAWLSEEWVSLTDSEDPVFGPASALAQATVKPVSDEEDMLAQTLASIEESAATRATLRAFLSRVPLTTE